MRRGPCGARHHPACLADPVARPGPDPSLRCPGTLLQGPAPPTASPGPAWPPCAVRPSRGHCPLPGPRPRGTLDSCHGPPLTPRAASHIGVPLPPPCRTPARARVSMPRPPRGRQRLLDSSAEAGGPDVARLGGDRRPPRRAQLVAVTEAHSGSLSRTPAHGATLSRALCLFRNETHASWCRSGADVPLSSGDSGTGR